MILPILLATVAAQAPAGPTPAQAPSAAAIERVTFDEAVRRALAYSLNSVVAAQEVRRAEALLVEARSNSLPSLGAFATQTRLDADRKLGNAVIAAKDQTAANLTLTVPLLAPSRWYQWSQFSRNVDTTIANEADTRRAVAITAARAYLSVIAARRAVEVSSSARDAARAHYDYAHTRRLAGVGNALDELQAEQELAASEVQFQNASALVSRDQEALGQICGEDRPLDAAAEPALPELPTPGAAQQEAEQARADVKAARARSYAAERVYKDSWADWMPTVLGMLQPFYQQPPSLVNPHTGWQAQLILSFPLFEGGLRVGQAKERDTLWKESDAQLQSLLRQARSEVRLAFEEVQRGRAALAAARTGSDSARTALNLSTEAYRAGAVNNLQVIDAERRARDAGLQTVIAEDNVRQSLLDLISAAGRFP